MTAITTILPAYNEEIRIGSIVLRTKQHADRVIVIDDGSTDRTAEVAELAGAEVIRHPVNKGKDASLKTGFAAADGADIIVTLNSDGRHDPAKIPEIIDPIKNSNYDVAVGLWPGSEIHVEKENILLYNKKKFN
ncbi:glycosyltransferase family 2 protein, partial [candidate division WOR-3 bacterium]|nr:glycosyltransferase family 2 protein [candidate division WOR-3 bacterium]